MDLGWCIWRVGVSIVRCVGILNVEYLDSLECRDGYGGHEIRLVHEGHDVKLSKETERMRMARESWLNR